MEDMNQELIDMTFEQICSGHLLNHEIEIMASLEEIIEMSNWLYCNLLPEATHS